ncbi:hypothetical protein MP228_002024 [Amoeboaphelidium protococcarum]|nr:hypothetical protein MP228_002024 [Amoeboaphelidium protococcarum]
MTTFFSKLMTKSKKSNDNLAAQLKAKLTKPLFLNDPYVRQTIVSGSMNNIISLPSHLVKYEDEWVATMMSDFFILTGHLYSCINEFCTGQSCPTMTVGREGCLWMTKYDPSSQGAVNEVLWLDSNKKNTKVSASQYIDLSMSTIQSVLEDGQIFPTSSLSSLSNGATDFSPQFKSIVNERIYKQLLRVFLHIYYAHYEDMLNVSMEGYLNTVFSHFVLFGRDILQFDFESTVPQGWMQQLVNEYLGSSKIGSKTDLRVNSNNNIAESGTGKEVVIERQ